MFLTRTIQTSIALTLTTSMAGAGDPIPLLQEGDLVAGVGFVTTISTLAINDAGQWMVEADTDNADTTIDGVLVRDGVLFIREGDSLVDPDGATVDSFDSIPLSATGSSAYNFFLDGTSGGNDDSGVYWDAATGGAMPVLVAQEGSEAPGLTPGTPFIGFFDVKINDVDQMLVMASVDDPNINSSVDRALYILETDSEAGGISTFTLIAAEGDVLPGQTEPIADFETAVHESAFNASGHALFGVDLTGDSAVDKAVYLYDGAAFSLLGQEGGASPVKGRSWSSLSSSELDLSDAGDVVFSGSLDGDASTNAVIIRNGGLFRQEGDAVTTSSGTWSLTSFGTGPLAINDCGEVLWFGDWDDPNGDLDTGLFLDDQLLVQEGVTTIGGVVVDTVRGIQDGYGMSGNGRYIVFEAVLVDGTEGAYMIDRGDACGAECAGDVTGDGMINTDDLLVLLAEWGPCPGCAGDVNGDDMVNTDDLLVVLAGWGPCR